MRAAMTRFERTPHGLLLHFPARTDIDTELRKFAIDEKGCCQFWGFAIDTIVSSDDMSAITGDPTSMQREHHVRRRRPRRRDRVCVRGHQRRPGQDSGDEAGDVRAEALRDEPAALDPEP
jgi:hypothetical protein